MTSRDIQYRSKTKALRLIYYGFIFFFLSPCLLYSQHESLIEFYDAFIYTQAKSSFSANTNFDNKANEIFQQLELKLRVNVSRDLFVYGMFKTEYVQFHWKRDDRQFFINSFGIQYNKDTQVKHKPRFHFKLGSLYLDYSPYLLKNYPWESDIFRGLQFAFEYRNLSLETFVANNGVDEDEGTLYSSVPTIDRNMDRDYSTIDLGYKDEIEQNQRPTWWYGGKLFYKLPLGDLLGIDLLSAYLNEEYQFTYESLFSMVFQNQYIFNDLTIHAFKYIDLNSAYSYCQSRVQYYDIDPDEFGQDKHLYTKMITSNYKPAAVKAGMEIPSLAGEYTKIYRTSIKFIYDKLDERYAPIYLDNKYQIRRSSDPDLNLYSGREGFFLVVRQYFLPETSIGYGYKQHKFKYNEMVPFLEDGRVIEHQLRIEETYLKYFKIKFIYQIQEAKNATFADGVKKLNAFYVDINGDVIEHVTLGLEYAHNLDYYQDYDQLAVKLLLWGF